MKRRKRVQKKVPEDVGWWMMREWMFRVRVASLRNSTK